MKIILHFTWVCLSVLISISFSFCDAWHALTWGSDLPSWAVEGTEADPRLVMGLPLTPGLGWCSRAGLDATVSSFVLLDGRTVLLAVGSGVWSPLVPGFVSDTLTPALSEFSACLFFIPLLTPRSGLPHFWSVSGVCSSGLLDVFSISDLKLDFSDLSVDDLWPQPFSLKMFTGPFSLLFWAR